MVDVVALESDQVAGSIEVDTPVGVAVAGSGVVSLAVDEVVGDGHTLGGVGSEDNVLATNASSLDYKLIVYLGEI